MRVLAIDPDPNGGSWAAFRGSDIDGVGWRTETAHLCRMIRLWLPQQVVVEDVQSYGMPVGASVFETVKNIGEIRGCSRTNAVPFDDSLTRPKIKAALCGSARAKDGNVRQALIDLYPATGGGKTPQVGTKAAPGPLYGVSKDVWAALAVGVVWLSLRGLGPLAERDGLRGPTQMTETGGVGPASEPIDLMKALTGSLKEGE